MRFLFARRSVAARASSPSPRLRRPRRSSRSRSSGCSPARRCPGRRRALLKLSPDGRLATLLRNRADDRDRYDLWAVDTATGQARMLVDSARRRHRRRSSPRKR